MRKIYLDYNASTPIDPAVAAAMRPLLDDAFGNPSSGHWASVPAKAALERARAQVAALLGSASEEIVFTSGSSEANNLAIKGTFFALRDKGEHIITTAVEHPAGLAPCRFLERLGATVTCLPVDSTGRVDPDEVRRAITPRTILISVMHANNEVGTIQPIEEIGAIARAHDIRFHTDAAQSVGKIPTNVDTLGVDLLTISRGGRGIYRVGVSFRPDRAFAGARGYGRAGKRRHGRGAFQSRSADNGYGNQCRRGTTCPGTRTGSLKQVAKSKASADSASLATTTRSPGWPFECYSWSGGRSVCAPRNASNSSSP